MSINEIQHVSSFDFPSAINSTNNGVQDTNLNESIMGFYESITQTEDTLQL